MKKLKILWLRLCSLFMKHDYNPVDGVEFGASGYLTRHLHFNKKKQERGGELDE